MMAEGQIKEAARAALVVSDIIRVFDESDGR
jgi:hypothetical protein